jgi:tetratricopeptide (TPR) repeat protein
VDLRASLRRDPGRWLLGLALIAAAALYAPTLGRGLVNFDDTWLYGDNYLLQRPSWATVATAFGDLHSPARLALGAEYLPIRDLSVMLDFAVWDTWYPGFHLTNLALYLAAVALFWAMLDGYGLDRTLVGVATLLWAVHPAHAESVAWLSERKGLLAVAFVLLAGVGWTRFRAGRHAGWLVLATLAAVAGVWSKAPAAVGLAALAPLELALPARRQSWRRSLLGLGVVGGCALAAFVPVVLVAASAGVVTVDGHGPSRLATALGGHGFYLRLALMAFPNAIAYPILTAGPSAVDLGLGAVGLAAILTVAVLPPRWRIAPAPPLRAAAILWLLGWLPASHLVLALQHVVADRYLMLPSLGVALAAAALLVRIPSARLRAVAIAAVTLAAAGRTLVAQAQWDSALTLWQSAVASDPDDGGAWSGYAYALQSTGQRELAEAAVEAGLARRPDEPKLALRKALLLLDRGDRAGAMPYLRRAATGNEPIAMSNLALVLLDDHALPEALTWARKAAALAPRQVHEQRTLGKIALAAGAPSEARAAFAQVLALEPTKAANHYNLALALLASDDPVAALAELDACGDPSLTAEVAAARAEAQRQLTARPR